MPVAESSAAMTLEGFLAWEAAQDTRHEYVAGEVYDHAEASDVHVTITLNLGSLLRAHLRGNPCRVYLADMRVLVGADAVFYPDVFVTCDPSDKDRTHSKESPVLVVEVLSPSTAAFDRGRKFAHYRSLPSLQEYLLIDTASRAVDLYRRGADGLWVLHPSAGGDNLTLASVAFTCSLDDLYEDVSFPSSAP